MERILFTPTELLAFSLESLQARNPIPIIIQPHVFPKRHRGDASISPNVHAMHYYHPPLHTKTSFFSYILSSFPPLNPSIHLIPFPSHTYKALAPSFSSFSIVCFLLCSITLLCLKYVTQLPTHSLRNPSSSTPHFSCALSFSFIESIIPCLSKQLKNRSRAS